MKYFIITILLIFGQALLGQKLNSFYFEPTLGTKVFTNKASNLPPTLTTTYFTIKPKQFIGPISIYIGCNVGITLKNNDKIQIGLSQDESTQGLTSYGMSAVSFTPNLFYANSVYSIYDGVACTNYSLLYKRSVLNIKSNSLNQERFLRIHFNLGLSYIHKPNNGLENLSGTGGYSFITPDSSMINIQVTTYNSPVAFKKSFKLNLGLDFTFGKKDREWFSLNLSFITNKSNGAYYSYISVQSFVAKGNKKEQYSYHIKGTGNGIYFTLSKRIYPVQLYKRIEAKRLIKYEQFKN